MKWFIKSKSGTFGDSLIREILAPFKFPEVGGRFEATRLRLDEDGNEVLGYFGPTSEIVSVHVTTPGLGCRFNTKNSEYEIYSEEG